MGEVTNNIVCLIANIAWLDYDCYIVYFSFHLYFNLELYNNNFLQFSNLKSVS